MEIIKALTIVLGIINPNIIGFTLIVITANILVYFLIGYTDEDEIWKI